MRRRRIRQDFRQGAVGGAAIGAVGIEATGVPVGLRNVREIVALMGLVPEAVTDTVQLLHTGQHPAVPVQVVPVMIVGILQPLAAQAVQRIFAACIPGRGIAPFSGFSRIVPATAGTVGHGRDVQEHCQQ